MNIYDRYILPPLTHYACATPLLARHRAALIPAARGQVLEIGIGSALNLDYYNAGSISGLTGIDPSRQLLAYAEKHIDRADFPVNLIAGSAESLPLPEASVDTIVVTFSLCSIPDVAAALEEMRRVLKPDGRLLFCEHGLAPETSVQRWQQRLDPLWGKIAGGCHLARNIPRLLSDANFRCAELQSAYLPHAPRFAGYIYRGSAKIDSGA
ncbi:MAG: class I SAM-dependent methyltransferase [Betaproteobacteria bacterium]|jgi:ubiquinone/menaquinone biosynthesis C-methylase UbiE|nr:MAG: class I SAM-dependent methyltransferase [Betaproteobacteria bacterium]